MDPDNGNDCCNWERLILCSLALFVNHGMRDFVITALPTIASSTTEEESVSTDHSSILTLDDLQSTKNCSSKHFSSYNFLRNSYTCLLRADLNTDEWSNATVGIALASFHLTCIFSLVAAFNLVPRLISSRLLLAINLFCSGFIVMFSELAANKGASNFIVLRAVQGLFQGLCYPTIYHIFQEIPYSKTAFRAFFGVFMWSWLGSGYSMAFGAGQHPFLAPYIFGPFAILLCVPVLLFKNRTQDVQKFTRAWSEVLSCKAVWSCLFIQFSVVWTLHTLAIGISFTKTYFMQDLISSQSIEGWSLAALFMLGAFFNWGAVLSAGIFMIRHWFSGLNKIRTFTGSGCLLVVIGISLCASIGLNSFLALCGVSSIVLAGVCLSFVGVRWNLHELAPIDATPVLIMGCIAGSLGAFTASMLFPVIADIGSQDLVRSCWNTAWLVVIVPVVLSAAGHFFLVSVRTLPYQSRYIPKISQECENRQVSTTDAAKSFKSVKSSATFKTAMSRFRSRTVTFNTVNEDIEADLESAIDFDEMKSVIPDSEEDMHSVRSGATSYCSHPDQHSKSAKEFGVILSAEDLDRTSLWLSIHHSVDDDTKLGRKQTKPSSIGDIMAVRNILVRIQW